MSNKSKAIKSFSRSTSSANSCVGAGLLSRSDGKQRVHEIVQDKIKTYIVHHNCKSGDALPNERELAALFNVSRTSIREAVKSLSALGILEARHGAGLFVQSFNMDRLLENFTFDLQLNANDLIDLHEIRFHIEYGMAGRAIRALTQQQIKDLQRIVERMRVKAEAEHYDSVDDREFHRMLWINVPNKAMDKMLDVTFLVRQRTVNEIKGNPIFIFNRHRKIFEALRDKDVNAMKLAIICHYTLVDSVSQINPDNFDADFIRHSLEFEMHLLMTHQDGFGIGQPPTGPGDIERANDKDDAESMNSDARKNQPIKPTL